MSHVDATGGCPAERFLEHGRLVRTPRRLDDRALVLEHLASRLLAPGEAATEPELTARIAALSVDPLRLRRDLVGAGLLGRRQDGTQYWRERVTVHDDEATARRRPNESWL